MEKFLYYNYALDRAKEWQKQAEIYSLISMNRQPKFRMKLAAMLHSLAKRLESSSYQFEKQA
jgi:hypothetical protein